MLPNVNARSRGINMPSVPLDSGIRAVVNWRAALPAAAAQPATAGSPARGPVP